MNKKGNGNGNDLLPEELIEKMIFKGDNRKIEGIEKEFNKALSRDRMFLFGLIIACVLVITVFLLIFAAYYTSGLKFTMAIFATLFLSVGTAIQAGTVMYGFFSKSLKERIDGMTKLVQDSLTITAAMETLISNHLRGSDIKATEEIITEYIGDRENMDPKATKILVELILNILLKNKRIFHPKDKITVLKVDRAVKDLQQSLSKSYLDPVDKVTACDQGAGSLVYIRQEFTKKTINQMIKANPVLKSVDFSALPDIRKRMTDQMNKLGIPYEDLTESTELWKSALTSHENKVLSNRIIKVERLLEQKNNSINANVNRFISYQVVLDTKIAVLCLAIAGVIGGLWDLIY